MNVGEQVVVKFHRQEDGRDHAVTGTVKKVLSSDSCAVYWEYYDDDKRFTERYTRVFTEDELYGSHR
jgi:hypothetical protein